MLVNFMLHVIVCCNIYDLSIIMQCGYLISIFCSIGKCRFLNVSPITRTFCDKSWKFDCNYNSEKYERNINKCVKNFLFNFNSENCTLYLDAWFRVLPELCGH